MLPHPVQENRHHVAGPLRSMDDMTKHNYSSYTYDVQQSPSIRVNGSLDSIDDMTKDHIFL